MILFYIYLSILVISQYAYEDIICCYSTAEKFRYQWVCDCVRISRCSNYLYSSLFRIIN